MPRRPAQREKGILILSDLHLTAGRNQATGTWSPTEDFFWDDDFADFLGHYGGSGGWTLIVNGDLFDFLQVLDRPSPEEGPLYGIPAVDRLRRHGLPCSEPAAVFQLDRIADGHPAAFRGLGEFLVRGNRIVLLKGNHDVQLFWPAVQSRLRERLAAALPAASPTARATNRRAIRANLEILPWGYLVPGLLFCEHGNQYEAATAFANFFHPLLPAEKSGRPRQIELDLGSLVVRYVSNQLEVLDPRADNYRPLSAYLALFFRRHPIAFLGTLRDALRYIRKSAEKALRTRMRARSGAMDAIAAENRAEIEKEADRLSRGDRNNRKELREGLIAVASSSAVPTLSTGVNRFLWQQVRSMCPLLRPRRGGKSALDDPVQQLRVAARDAAERLKVRYVVFGHSHVEDEVRLPGGATYFNTGTWIAVTPEDAPLHRGMVQFTYLKIEGGGADLLRWERRGAVPRPAVIMDGSPLRRR